LSQNFETEALARLQAGTPRVAEGLRREAIGAGDRCTYDWNIVLQANTAARASKASFKAIRATGTARSSNSLNIMIVRLLIDYPVLLSALAGSAWAKSGCY